MDLNSITYSYSNTNTFTNTTVGRSDPFSGCGATNGKTYKFYVMLQPGQSLTIAQTSNTFDSKHSSFWSTSSNPRSFPPNSYHCTDDPDTQTMTMTNSQSSPRKVWYVVNGYSNSKGCGTFTLAWKFGAHLTSLLRDP